MQRNRNYGLGGKMENRTINLYANNQTLVIDKVIEIVSDTENYIYANVDLGENWQSFDSVRAIWSHGVDVSMVLNDGRCKVPADVIADMGVVKVNLVGSNVENDVLVDRLTTEQIPAILVKQNVPIDGTDPQEVTPSQFEQFVEAVKDDADRAEQSASEAETSAQNASDSATSAHNSAESAHDDKIAIEQAIAEVIQQIEDFEQVQVVVNTLPPSSQATSDFTDGVLTLGIPQGVKGDTGNGIQSITKTGTSGLVDTYTITFTDGNTTTFTVTNGAKGDTGNGIASIEKTSTVGLVDTYTITYTDGNTSTFTVTNGEKGDKGDTGEVSQAELDEAVTDLKSALNEVKEQTYNLLLSVISGASVNSSGSIYTDSNYDLGIAPIELNEKYTVKTNDSSLVCGFFSAVPAVGSVSYDASRLIQSSKTFTAPCNGYIAFRMLAGYSQPQIVDGTSDKDYISPISATDYIARESSASAIENANVKPRNINNGIFKNMLDPLDTVDGYYIDHSNGTYDNQSSTYWRSGFIPVKPNTSYTSSSYNRVAFYDENKTFISGSGHYGDYSYMSPNNAAYIMVCDTPLTSKSKYVLAETANYDGLYYPFGVRIPWLIESKSRLEGKKMVCFGDSITNMGYVDTILENSGIIAENVGLSSGRYANVDNATIDAFSFYNIIYAIANNDWTIPDSLSGQTGYETQYAHIQAIKAIDFSEIDYVSFAYGTNDFSSSTPIDNENDPYDPNYFMGAMRYCIKTFLQKYPHIKLLVATPCYRFWQESGVFIDDCNTHEIGGKKLSDYVDAEISVCEEMHIPYVDNLTCAGINQYNRTQYFDANDGLHPNAKGRAIIGGRITDGIFYNY